MKFLVDAHLPKRLARFISRGGHDAIHTLELPAQNSSGDDAIIQNAIKQDRIVITKDSDFVDSFLLFRKPPRLLLVSTGNISNDALEELFDDNLSEIVSSFKSYSYVELTVSHVIVHQ